MPDAPTDQEISDVEEVVDDPDLEDALDEADRGEFVSADETMAAVREMIRSIGKAVA